MPMSEYRPEMNRLGESLAAMIMKFEAETRDNPTIGGIIAGREFSLARVGDQMILTWRSK